MSESRSRKSSPPAPHEGLEIAPSRRDLGPRSLAALLPDVTRPAFEQRPAAQARLMSDWALIVGAQLAAVTAPKKFAAGTLTVACAGPVALELQHLADTLIARINQHMGQALVKRLRLTQDSLAAPAATLPPRTPRRLDAAALDRRLAGLPEGPLRTALACLAQAMANR